MVEICKEHVCHKALISWPKINYFDLEISIMLMEVHWWLYYSPVEHKAKVYEWNPDSSSRSWGPRSRRRSHHKLVRNLCTLTQDVIGVSCPCSFAVHWNYDWISIHSNTFLATVPLRLWIFQERPHNYIIFNEIWGKILLTCSGKNFLHLRKQI